MSISIPISIPISVRSNPYATLLTSLRIFSVSSTDHSHIHLAHFGEIIFSSKPTTSKVTI